MMRTDSNHLQLRRNRGVTALELVALVAATGAVLVVALLPPPGLSAEGQVEVAAARLVTLKKGIEEWQRLSADDPHLPALPAKLDELRTGPADYPERWRNLVGGDAIPLDPWGNAFRYEVTDAAANQWHVCCAGPDGQFDTPDDQTQEPTPPEPDTSQQAEPTE